MNKRRFAAACVLGVAIVGGLWYIGDHPIDSLGAPADPSSVASPPASPDESAPPASSVSPSAPAELPSETPEESPAETPKETKPAKPANPPKASETPETPSGEESPAFALLADSLPGSTIKTNKDRLAVVTNPSSLYVLANKKRNLPSDYVPDDLVVPDVPFSFSGDSPKKKMRKAAADALESLFQAAEDDGIELKAVSGYRSYATQKSIFQSNADRKGEEVANRTSARPGQSEHQTGLAMDVSSASAGYGLEETFGDTKEGKWLAKHAAEHGFIIRFLKGKESITGYSYEPWHVRYVGKTVAKEIMNKKITLEEYLEDVEAKLKA